MAFERLKRLKEKIPSTDPLERVLCNGSRNCEIIPTPYDLVIKVTDDQVCLYKVSEVTVTTRQREKLTLSGGVELDQEASYRLTPIGCLKRQNVSIDELRENPLKILLQLQAQKNDVCSCTFINKDSQRLVSNIDELFGL